ncbi:BamA/TamA family outer membrane protein [Mucilaginibacter arboris]|uniref:BamA/TamA family outer membrane protein n=1 Tax=Mucilaginibacter arboris TaxID=2682090 RepID=A0A7K1SU22_9SPHI|nr:BamA/TamA family outer membrane protein [Mucilaginibacter arboris]MVN20570.1 BamA/TamA family outer membrane protein [Mucilaginibacter arboris]
MENRSTSPLKDTVVAQKDIIDIIRSFRKKPPARTDSVSKQFNFSLVPSAGYTLSTGFAADLSGNVVFYTDKNSTEKLSTAFSNVTYDQHKQFLFHTNTNIWSKNLNYNYIGDWRFLKYPESTFGLGSLTTEGETNLINYSYFRFYQTVLRKIYSSLYTGFGYNFDYHYHITQTGNADKTISDFKIYGLNSKSRSSGLTYNLLFDNRKNPVNPLNGVYANAIYRSNFQFLGSDSNWQSLTFDFRKYFKVGEKSNNILAFWMLDWLILNGHPPYLDLPSTGWDTNGNTGRGYPQGRFRGNGMLYLEGEYRFNITRNGLLGGVVFTNLESFSSYQDSKFQRILPGYGPGLRIKFNKHSNTNLCIDYGIGNSSQGFFVNLGEVF